MWVDPPKRPRKPVMGMPVAIDVVTAVIASVGTSIIAPIFGYLKIQDQRRDAASRRDTQLALLQQEVGFLKSLLQKEVSFMKDRYSEQFVEVAGIKESLGEIKASVSLIAVTMQFLKERFETEK